jgi:N-acetyl-gamma-glutamyl-phosphate reductase
MVRAGIVGVSGYGGGELARLLSQHPQAKITYVTSETYKEKPISSALPGFAGRSELICEVFDVDVAVTRCDVVFLAQGAGFAMNTAGKLIEAGKKVIDLSADFRLKDCAEFSKWYRMDHTCADLVKEAAYGLPELHRKEIASARLVANPGCFPTSAILGLAPLFADQLIELDSIIINSLSGVSGAGRSKQTLSYHFPELNENASPYGVGGTHRHTPEIEQELSQLADEKVQVSFTPHLIPVTRGILTTSYANLTRKVSSEDLIALYRTAYEREPFVIVLDKGMMPSTKQVCATNNVLIGLAVDARTGRVTVASSEDNLVKGMAGQAIQNMNLMYGLPETTGLTMTAIWP